MTDASTAPAVSTIEREGVTSQVLTGEALAILQQGPTPGPGGRVSRSAGQLGGATVLVELWQAFGWFGASEWTAEEAAQRWPAITATLVFAVVVGHNVANWAVAIYRERARRRDLRELAAAGVGPGFVTA